MKTEMKEDGYEDEDEDGDEDGDEPSEMIKGLRSKTLPRILASQV